MKSSQANCLRPSRKLRIFNSLFTTASADLPRLEGGLTVSESKRLFRRSYRCDQGSDYGNDCGNNLRSLYRNGYGNILRILYRSDYRGDSEAENPGFLLTMAAARD